MLKFEQIDKQLARIKVVGVGGGGSNAVDHMVDSSIEGVEFAVVNTDVQVLARSLASEKIQIGNRVTRGLGTGGNPELGRQAALDDKDLLKEMLEGVDILFITAGFGGGTGTGASAVIGQIAKEMGALTLGVATKPFTFEGKKRMFQAEQGLKEFREQVNTIICIPNDKVFNMINQDTPLFEAYRMTDQILRQAVESISQVIVQPGLINLDFADIQTILSIKGGAVIGFGEGVGKDKAAKAVQSALSTPLLETKELRGAKGILISIVGGNDLSLYEVNNAIGSIHEIADENANIIIGAIIHNEITERAMVTLIATGLNSESSSVLHSQGVVMPLDDSITEMAEEKVEGCEEKDTQRVKDELEPVDDNIFEPEKKKEPEPVLVSSGFGEINAPQGEFFDETDPTVYQGSNLDIPSFLRRKKRFSTTN
ncbi:cell division protein FtsZ [bacterium]|nr:cell division protein FtsZ [bacterium]